MVAGCGSSSEQPSKASPGAPPTDETVTPTPAGPTVITRNGPVEAGPYRIDVAEPPIEITLDGEGWYAGRPQPAFNAFNLYPSDPDAYLVVFRPEAVYDDGDTNPDPLPANLTRWLRDRPSLNVGQPTGVTIDGRPATRFDATVAKPNTTCDMGDGKDTPCALLAPVPANEPLRIAAGEKVRFWVLDVDGPVLVMVSHRVERFDSWVSDTAAVVESLHFVDE